MKLQDLSLSQRLAAGLGCVVILALLVSSLLYGAFELIIGQKTAEELESAPLGWTQSLREWGRLHEPGSLALARTDSGDGSAAAWDSAYSWHRAGIEQAYRAAIGSATPSSLDSSAWRAIWTDTTLDRFARAARREQWHALGRLVASDTSVQRNILLLPLPPYSSIRDAGRALVIRGLLRLSRGDRDGARADLGAAVSLGDQMFRHEPVFAGTLTGRGLLSSGARGWERYALATRDSALASRARALAEWTSLRLDRTAELLLVAPDSAMTLAGDSSLALGLRAQAMVSTVLGSLVRPRGFVFGVPSRHRRALRSLAAGQGDAGRLAAMAAATAERTGLPQPGALTREVQSRRP